MQVHSYQASQTTFYRQAAQHFRAEAKEIKTDGVGDGAQNGVTSGIGATSRISQKAELGEIRPPVDLPGPPWLGVAVLGAAAAAVTRKRFGDPYNH